MKTLLKSGLVRLVLPVLLLALPFVARAQFTFVTTNGGRRAAAIPA